MYGKAGCMCGRPPQSEAGHIAKTLQQEGKQPSGELERKQLSQGHKLRTAEGGTCQDTERKQHSKDSSSGDCRRSNIPGHRMKVTLQYV